MNPIVNVKEIESKLNFTFTQPQLLVTAFTHPSYRNESPVPIEDSERLEFLGDAVLGLIVTEHLFLLFPNLEEGVLSTIRASLVDASACSGYAESLGVCENLLIGKGERLQNQRGKLSSQANLFEAILGAIYLDGGLSPARQLTVPLLPSKEKLQPLMFGNPKNLLQQFTQKYLRTLPKYQATQYVSKEGVVSHHVQVFIHDELWGEGVAHSKKEAEKLAAQHALDTHDYKK